MKPNNLLITISGPDRPGITSTLMKIIVRHKKQVLDMGQAVTHGLLSLSILISLGDETDLDESPVLKDLLFAAKQLKMQLEFQNVEDYHQPAPHEKFILSCVNLGGLSAEFISKISEVMASHYINISRIDNISDVGFKSLDFTTNTTGKPTDWTQLKLNLMKVADEHKVDLAFLKDDVFRRNKRLIVFDMDSTLIQAEVIDELAELQGVGKEVKAITEKAMNGEINFDESLKRRVSLLKGLKESELRKVAERLPLTSGVEEFIKTVKSLGYKLAIISGGFNYFAHNLRHKLGIDYHFANDLEFENGIMTGNIKGTIVNAEQKAVLLEFIAQQEGIHLGQVVAIGDGANDLPMLARAGLGIAFHAKEIVKKQANQHIGHGPMTSILYFLGIPGPKDYKAP
ncbi:MAG: phosphoserine phosphatase SerB [Bacteriovoracaceae bacterium]|nr:phosphoserine phosphatase SerB [Bacteriovoracaceae bacterium]